MKNLSLLLVLLSLFVISACEKEVNETEKNSYNAYFIYPAPGNKTVYVGSVTGLSSCKYVVSEYYSKRRKFIKGEWDYICCLDTEEGVCAEQHRYGDD